jgi:hypothetical protein
VLTNKNGVGLVVSLLIGLSACGDDAEVRPSCTQLCERIEAPACPNAAPDCLAACEDDMGTTPAACDGELDTLSRCFAGATFQCDENGVPEANACKDELDTWLECRAHSEGDGDDGESDGNADGSSDGGGGAEDACTPHPDDATCDLCVKDACCAELSVCGPACQQLFSCAEFCADDACIELCVQQHLEGAQAAAALSACLGNRCALACGG